MAEARAEIVANVWKLLAREGEPVATGDTLAVLETMKMEIPVYAEGPGVIREVPVTEGQIVQEGDLLVVIDDAR